MTGVIHTHCLHAAVLPQSWDRQPFLTTVRTDKPDMTPAYREIHHNVSIQRFSLVLSSNS
jgi:hypothetical protein